MKTTIQSLILPVALSVTLIGVAVGLPVYALKKSEDRANRLSTAYMALQTEHSTYRSKVERDAQLAQAATKKSQAKLDDEQRKAKELKDEEIRNLKRRVSDLVGELRNRADRPQQPAAHQAPGAGHQEADTQLSCTGAQLYRQDGEFLAGEAAAADEVRAELRQCHADLTAAHTSSEQLKAQQAVFFGQEPN